MNQEMYQFENLIDAEVLKDKQKGYGVSLATYCIFTKEDQSLSW